MYAVEEKEVIVLLLQKFIDEKLDFTKKQEKLERVLAIINRNPEITIDRILENEELLNELLTTSRDLRDFIHKNYFKVLQSLKKEKEEVANLLFDENRSLVEILAKFIFPYDYSRGKFVLEYKGYVLRLPDKTIIQKHAGEPVSHNVEKKTLQKEKKGTEESLTEEISILQELSLVYPASNAGRNLVSEIALRRPVSKEEEKQKESTVLQKDFSQEKQKEEVSIIYEILQFWDKSLKENLADRLEKQNWKKQKDVTVADSETTQPERIPYTISEFAELRRKLQNFYAEKDMDGYKKFIATSGPATRAVVGILNIMQKENENGDRETLIRNLSQKINIPENSLLELYHRVKRYHSLLSYFRQLESYLQGKDKRLYENFIMLYEPLLDFFSYMEEQNMKEKEFLDGLNVVLLPVSDAAERKQLENFLKQVYGKIQDLLSKSRK